MKILVTGAGGQLALALADELSGQQLVSVARSRMDIANLDQVVEVIETERPDVVINAAAYTAVDQAESDPNDAYAGNALGPRNLAVATARLGLPLVHVSTDYVFDGLGTRPYHEFDPTNPRSIYGFSKLAGELEVRSLNPKHYIVRTAWLYHTIGQNFPKTMISLSDRAELKVVSDQYGSPTFAPHLAAALGKLIETEAYGTYHMAGQGATSWFELTQTLFAKLNIDTAVYPVATSDFPRPAPRPRYSALTTMQSPKILLPRWEEGLEEFTRAVKAGTVQV
ncbi:MAG: dTDP-4-dehydrorhamnose reductase [Planctomycetota bacterium]